MTKSKLTPHVLVPNSGSPLLVKAGCPLIKSVGDMGILLEAQQINPNIIAIGRFDNPRLTAEQLRDQFPNNPERAAATWINTYKDLWRLNKHVLYIELPNEPVFKKDNNTDDIDGLLWLNQFMTQCVLLMASLGLRSVGPNFSTGYPDIGSLVAIMPFLKALKDHKGIFSLHGYSIGRPIESDYECFRHELIYNQVLLPNGLKDLPIAYTEWGVIEYKSDIIQNGILIRSALSDDEYANQLIEADSRLRSFPGNLLAVTIYTFGSNNVAWDNYNVGNDGNTIPGKLAAHIMNTNDNPTPPQPPVSGKFKVGDTVEVTQEGDGLRVRSTPVINVNNILGKHPAKTTAIVTGGPIVSSGLVWWELAYKDMNGVSAESQNGVEYLKLHVADPILTPTPDLVKENLLLNPDLFSAGIHNSPGHDNIRIADGWDFKWLDQLQPRLDRQDPFAPWLQPETQYRSDDGRPGTEKLPPDEVSIYLTDKSRVVFHVFKLYGIQWWYLYQSLVLPAGEYEFSIDLYPDIYIDDHQFITNEMIAGEWRLNVNEHASESLEKWGNGGDEPLGKGNRIYFGHWRKLTKRFVHPGGLCTVELECRARWGVKNLGFFIRDTRLSKI